MWHCVVAHAQSCLRFSVSRNILPDQTVARSDHIRDVYIDFLNLCRHNVSKPSALTVVARLALEIVSGVPE